MRKFLILVLCCVLLAGVVYADNAATNVQTGATVLDDGSCKVSLSMSIRLDQAVSDLSLPLGTDIGAVTVNGNTAELQQSGGVTSVMLSSITSGVTGNVSILVNFTVNSCLSTDEDGNTLVTVPLLYGFAYPVEAMSFSITMPGEFDTVPIFLSGYHKQDIESDMEVTVSGNIIQGTVNTALKDHETLTMTLEAPEDMFPQKEGSSTLMFDAIAMAVCGALALVYWLITMAAKPARPIQRSTAPEGITAGNVDSYLARQSADLTMMVVSWAQLGYLIIHLDDNGRVFLHKKMDMGNERSSFEGKAFRSLFGKRDMIDATSYHYARVWEKVANSSRKQSWGYQKGSGNPMVLRILGCGMGLCAGVAMGDSFTSDPAWRVILMLLLACVGTFGSWYIQEGLGHIHSRRKEKLIPGGVCALVLLILGQVSGCPTYAAAATVANALLGVLAAYTGHRTENGEQIRDELLGLRKHMGRAERNELKRILRVNPDYYYELAPYALAMGVDKKFAKRFGNLRLPNCTWLVSNLGTNTTAMEWHATLREAVHAMNNQQKRPPWEKLLNIR